MADNQENQAVQGATTISSRHNVKTLTASDGISERRLMPLGERRDNQLSPCSSTASISAKSTSDAFFSPPATTSSIKSDITSPPYSALRSAEVKDEAAQTGISPQKRTSAALEKTSSASSSPSKHARLPSLDAIAARLNKAAFEQAGGQTPLHKKASESSAAVDADRSSSTGTAQRGRSEALASLRERAANRSRSTSPVKRALKSQEEQDTKHRSSQKHIPTLEEIALRLGKREPVIIADAAPDARSVTPLRSPSPLLACGAVSSAPPSPSPIHNLAHGLPPGFSSSEFLTPSKTRSKAEAYATWRKAELARQPKDHPLEHVWGIYFDCKTWTPASPAHPSPALETPHSWESALRLLGHFVTVESFMSVFRTLRRPSQLERNSSYHLFKNGIKPMWEDQANAQGGKWTLTLRSGNAGLLDRSWMWLVLAIIGEDLDDGDDITGAVVSTRAKGDRIALWIREKTPVDKVNRIGQRFVELLEMQKEPGISLEFTVNNRNDTAAADQGGAYMSIDNPLPRDAPSPQLGLPGASISRNAFSRSGNLAVPSGARHGSHSPQMGNTSTSRSPTIPLACLGNSPSKSFVGTLRASNACAEKSAGVHATSQPGWPKKAHRLLGGAPSNAGLGLFASSTSLNKLR